VALRAACLRRLLSYGGVLNGDLFTAGDACRFFCADVATPRLRKKTKTSGAHPCTYAA
jgi:hypothetical protein